MQNSRSSPKLIVLIFILVVSISLPFILNNQKLDKSPNILTATPIVYLASETFIMGQAGASGDQTATANGIEIRLEKFDIMTSSLLKIDNKSINNVDTFICFDKPDQNNWILGPSQLEIRNEKSIMNTNTLLFDSKEGFLGEGPSPNWLPIGGDKRCFKSSFLFAPSATIIWQLANGLDVTTNFALTISQLRTADWHSLDGPWEFDLTLIP